MIIDRRRTYEQVKVAISYLVTLDQSRLVDETLVDVEGRHVVDNDGALEVFLRMLRLQDVLQQSRLPGSQESAQKGDGQ